MASSHYFCPNCYAQYEKGMIRMLGGLIEAPIKIRSEPGEVRWCSSCGEPIKAEAIADGDLDCERWAQTGAWIGITAGAILGVYLFGWKIWPIVGVAFAGNLSGALLFGLLERLRVRRFRLRRARIERLKADRLAEESRRSDVRRGRPY
jgi:hypothetical protein